MNSKTYKEWWPLHLRAAKGEFLSSDEQKKYEAGLEELFEEERLLLKSNDEKELLELRQKVEELRVADKQLMDESKRLEKKIAELEETYQTLTGYSLTLEANA